MKKSVDFTNVLSIALVLIGLFISFGLFSGSLQAGNIFSGSDLLNLIFMIIGYVFYYGSILCILGGPALLIFCIMRVSFSDLYGALREEFDEEGKYKLDSCVNMVLRRLKGFAEESEEEVSHSFSIEEEIRRQARLQNVQEDKEDPLVERISRMKENLKTPLPEERALKTPALDEAIKNRYENKRSEMKANYLTVMEKASVLYGSEDELKAKRDKERKIIPD